MPIANQFVRDFDAIARAGGAEDFELGLSQIRLLAPRAVQFKIATREPALATLDWSEAESIGLHCSCSSFAKELCHHAWTALLAFDQSTEFEIAEAREKLEGIKLKLKRLLNTEASLQDAVDLQIANQWPLSSVPPKARIEFEQDTKAGTYSLSQIAFSYGDQRIVSSSPRKEFLDRTNQKRLKRNLSAEKELLKNFRGDFTPKKLATKKFSGADLKSFMSQSPHLQFALDGKAVAPLDVREARLEERNGRYEFTATFSSDDQTFNLKDVVESPDSKDSFFTLKNGTTAYLPDDWSKRLEILSRSTSITKDGALAFHRASLPFLRSAFDGITVTDEARAVFESLAKLAESGQATPPRSLQASLRSYQAEGLFWLLKMSNSGFGGILADDMGLGKTVQIISYLLTRAAHFRAKTAEQKPCLVVVPKSLVQNWKNEVEKFGPSLRVLDFAGANRVIFRPQFFDVVLTTYHVLKNEIDRLRAVDFDTIILDEAQAIKNPTSQIAKAVLQLQARQRFALSGTPVENSLKDLFSLLNFTNPGLIPHSFVNAYGDRKSLQLPKSVTEKIAATVKPFILRRTKKQVLTELPDKSEQVLVCEMESAQKNLYDKTRKHFRLQLKANAQETPNGPKTTRVFEALLRLRQISCHPALIGSDGLAAESAKVEMLLEHLEEIRASGHKALVFSQFTSFLDLLKPELKKAGILFEHLDGQTRNRGAVVDRFNSDPKTTVFLISLKAGGTGLNLTTASYVFLMDPWWNPAVESQAIDRAYRMGQKQKVMAYRLIAKGSIEEKILKLQDQKRDLAQSLVSEDGSFGRTLSLDELEFLLDA